MTIPDARGSQARAHCWWRKNKSKIQKAVRNYPTATNARKIKQQQKVFEKLKDILCSEPVPKAPDLAKPFTVTTDSSDYALGAVLNQGKIVREYLFEPLKHFLTSKQPDLRFNGLKAALISQDCGIQIRMHFCEI